MGSTDSSPVPVYWHRNLPPLELEPVGEHVIEATSQRVRGRISRHGDSWERCHDELMTATEERLKQEIRRLGGRCAHVLEEHIDVRHDPTTDESWLHGRFEYVLYR